MTMDAQAASHPAPCAHRRCCRCVLMVGQSATPRGLQDILQEYTVLKARAGQVHTAMTMARRLSSASAHLSSLWRGPPVGVCVSAEEHAALVRSLHAHAAPSESEASSGAASLPVTMMDQLADLLGDYSAARRMAATGIVPGGRVRRVRAAESLAPMPTLATAAAAQAAPAMSQGSTAAAEAVPAPAPSLVSPLKRRRKGSPQRRIVPHPVYDSSAADPMYTSALHNPLPAAAVSVSPPPLLRPLSPFQLPTHLPLHRLGAFVEMSVDREGFEQLFAGELGAGDASDGGVQHASAFTEALAAFINQRAEQQMQLPQQQPHPGLSDGSAFFPATTSAAAAASTSSSASGARLASPPSVPLSLSDAALKEITEICLRDPATSRLLDQAFSVAVPDDASMLSPSSQQETPNDADRDDHHSQVHSPLTPAPFGATPAAAPAATAVAATAPAGLVSPRRSRRVAGGAKESPNVANQLSSAVIRPHTAAASPLPAPTPPSAAAAAANGVAVPTSEPMAVDADAEADDLALLDSLNADNVDDILSSVRNPAAAAAQQPRLA